MIVMDVLVTYDIADTETNGASRLRRIAALCERYGQRVQFSVFECRLSAAKLARFVGELEATIDRTRDSVLVYRFTGGIEVATLRLGRGPEHLLGKPWIL